MKRLKLFVPLVIFVVVAAFFYVMINRIDRGDYNPQSLPSALLNRPFPEFSLPVVEEAGRRVSRADLLGHIALVNVWATWCPSCHREHAYLNTLATEKGVLIFGINYKDKLPEARQWLQQKGNPYRFNIFDAEGRLGLDIGVTGAPETYLIDHRGFVRLRYQGPLDETVWQDKFAPLIRQLRLERSEYEQRVAG